jgi:hypothetical protein
MRNNSFEAITGADEPGIARTNAESSPPVAPRYLIEDEGPRHRPGGKPMRLQSAAWRAAA